MAPSKERCEVYKDGIIPGCMGTAAAFGCEKTDEEILSYCTCEDGPVRIPGSIQRVKATSPASTSKEVRQLKAKLKSLEIKQNAIADEINDLRSEISSFIYKDTKSVNQA